MTNISIAFQGDSWESVASQMREALGLNRRSAEDFPDLTPEPLSEPEPKPDPVPVPKTAKKPRAAPAPAPVPAPAPEPVKFVAPPELPEPEPEIPDENLPSLETLKAIITAAVRAAQQKKGPDTILDLLPDFKARTGLAFVMNAEEKHRSALAALIEAAGLALEPA